MILKCISWSSKANARSKEGTYSYIDGAIDFAVYKDTEDNNMMVRMFRLGKVGDWYIPKPRLRSEVSTRITYGKQMSVTDAWQLILSMMIMVKWLTICPGGQGAFKRRYTRLQKFPSFCGVTSTHTSRPDISAAKARVLIDSCPGSVLDTRITAPQASVNAVLKNKCILPSA